MHSRCLAEGQIYFSIKKKLNERTVFTPKGERKKVCERANENERKREGERLMGIVVWNRKPQCTEATIKTVSIVFIGMCQGQASPWCPGQAKF